MSPGSTGKGWMELPPAPPDPRRTVLCWALGHFSGRLLISQVRFIYCDGRCWELESHFALASGQVG